MAWKVCLGKFHFGWGKIQTIGDVHVVTIDKTFTVRKPHIVEETVEFTNQIPIHVDEVVEVPNYKKRYVEKEFLLRKTNLVEDVHDFHVQKFTEVAVDVEVPVQRVQPIEDVLEIEIQRTEITEKAVKMVTEYPEFEDVPVPLPRVVGETDQAGKIIIPVTCPCGNVYGSNMTRCVKCGRATLETLRGMSGKR